MGRRRRRPRKARQGPGHNEANRRTSESRQRSPLLDERVEHKFRYYAEEMLMEADVEPELWRPFLQTLWTRGSRQGVDEAKEYLDTAREEGIVDDDLHQGIAKLIRKYRTMR